MPPGASIFGRPVGIRTIDTRKEGIRFVKEWRFELSTKTGFTDVHGKKILQEISELGVATVSAVETARVFLVEAGFDSTVADRVGHELLVDPVCEEVRVGRGGSENNGRAATQIENAESEKR